MTSVVETKQDKGLRDKIHHLYGRFEMNIHVGKVPYRILDMRSTLAHPPKRKLGFCMSCLKSWVGMLITRGGSQECPNCRACKESVEHVLFSVHHIIPRYWIFGNI